MKYFERVIFIEDVLHFFTVSHYIMIDLVIIKCLEQCDCFIGSLVLFCFFTLNVACISQGVCGYSKGAFHLSELTGEKLDCRRNGNFIFYQNYTARPVKS